MAELTTSYCSNRCPPTPAGYFNASQRVSAFIPFKSAAQQPCISPSPYQAPIEHFPTLRENKQTLIKPFVDYPLQPYEYPSPRLSTALLAHSPREPNPDTHNRFSFGLKIPDAIKMKPGALSEAVIKGLAYLAIHPIAIMRTRSISMGLELPSPTLIFPLRAAIPCASHELFEYALAVYLNRKLDHVVSQIISKHERHNELTTVTETGARQRPPYILNIVRNFISAFATAMPSLAWERINQQLILGMGLKQAVEVITGQPAYALRQHPSLIKEFFRGLPIAVLSITTYLMVQELSKPEASTGFNNTTIENATSSKHQSPIWAAVHMAFLGFLGGIIQATVNTSQIHSISTAETMIRFLNRPQTPLVYGVLGAVSLGFLEFAIKALTPTFTQTKQDPQQSNL